MAANPNLKHCESCGEAFPCGATQGHCWCMDLPVADTIPTEFGDCLCEKCLKKFTSESALVENEDYYFENGLMVFTEAYHLKRGFCCNSGCRHCPYKNSPL